MLHGHVSKIPEIRIQGVWANAVCLRFETPVAGLGVSVGGQHRLRPDNAFVANFAGDGEAQRDSGDKVPKSQGA